MIKVGRIRYSKAGAALVRVIAGDRRFELRWIARRSGADLAVGSSTQPAHA